MGELSYLGKKISKQTLVITGSDSNTFLQVEQADSGSTAIKTNNIQNGYPTSNPWGTSLEGSYFNNFDNTTHVSEILRFMSGVLSHSLDVSDASPNTKTYGSVWCDLCRWWCERVSEGDGESDSVFHDPDNFRYGCYGQELCRSRQ